MHPINERILKIIDTKFNSNKTKFAKALDIPPTMMSSYFGEKRASKPNIDMLSNIVKKLGVDARWLLTGEEYPVAANYATANNSNIQDASFVNSPVFIGVPSEIKDMIMHLEAMLKEKERLIEEKDERIKELKERIEELKAQKK